MVDEEEIFATISEVRDEIQGAIKTVIHEAEEMYSEEIMRYADDRGRFPHSSRMQLALNEEIVRASEESIAREIAAQESELSERVHVLENQVLTSNVILHKLSEETTVIISKLALIRAQRLGLKRMLKKYAIESRTLASASNMEVRESENVDPLLAEKSAGDCTRQVDLISKLEQKLQALKERLIATADRRRSVNLLEDSRWAAISKIVGPDKSHHSQLNHDQKDQLVTLLLSYV